MVIPSLIATSLVSLVLLGVYIYFYLEEREEYIRQWTLGWGIYFLRMVIEYLMLSFQGNFFLIMLHQLTTLLSGLFLLRGTYIYLGKPFHNFWSHITWLGIILILIGNIAGLGKFLVNLSTMFLAGSMYIWTGGALYGLNQLKGKSKTVIAWSLILLGIHHWDFPFLYSVPWFTQWGYLIGTVLKLFIAIGLLLLIYEKNKDTLIEKEKRFRLLAENARDVIYRYRFTPTPGLEYVSPATINITGYTPEEYYRDPQLVFKIIHPEDKHLLEMILKNQKNLSPLVLRWIRKDGSVIWIEQHHVPVYDENGRLVAYEGIAREITQRKLSEEFLRNALEDSRRRQERILEQLSDKTELPLLNQDFKDTAKEVFDSCKKILGASCGYIALPNAAQTDNEIIYLDTGGIACGVSPSIPMPLRGMRERSFNFGKAVYDNDFAKSNWAGFLPQGHIPIENAMFIPLIIREKVIGLLGLANKPGGFNEHDASIAMSFGKEVAVDLYNSHLLAKLKDSEERFRSVAQSATDAIVSVNQEANIVFWNRAAEDIFGYKKEEVEGKSLDIILPAQCPVKEQQILENFLENDPIFNLKTIEMLGLNKEGKQIPLEFSLSNWQQGDRLYLTVIIRDITDRKQAEQSLKRYQHLFKNANDCILVLNYDDGKIIDANPIALTTYGYTYREILTKSIFDLRLEQKDIVIEQLKKANKDGLVFETVHWRKDGSAFPVEVSSQGVIIDGKTVLFSIIRDISERKQAEEFYKRYQTLFENARDKIIFARVPDGHILEVNQAALRNYGYTKEEMLSMTLHQLRAGEQRAAVDKTIEKADQEGINFETLHSRKDGTTFPVEINSKGVNIGDQRVLVAILRDITERKNAEEALAREKERLAVTLRSIGEGVITTDIEGKVVLLNKVAEKLTGWLQEEVTGRPLGQVYQVIDEKTRLPLPDTIDKVLIKNGFRNPKGHILVSRDGTERIITDCGTPIYNQNSVVIGIVLVFRDITEERKTKEELLKANKLESLSILAGGIAHDFNNFLTTIVGNLSLLKTYNRANSEITQIINEFEQVTWRAKGLTQQLLTFAKGGAPIKKSASLREIIKDTADFALRGSKISCVYTIAGDLWPVEVDEGQISQVINNIVINAIQAMPKGGTIGIKCENIEAFSKPPALPEPRQYIKVSIQDQGQGIPKEHYGKLFDPYFTTKLEGTGLGLATSYSIINMHNGLIEVTSEVGKGTTFTFYLPAFIGQIDNKHEVEDYFVDQGKILIMDDDALILSVARKILKYLGYQADFASHGAEAIEKYNIAKENGSSYDAVIMDLTIPGAMGGLETMKQLIRIDPNIKAIVSSGYSTDPVMAEYKKYGFKAVVSKPYKIEDMGKALNKTLSE